MYIRFVVGIIDENSGRRLGLFQVSRELREFKEVSVYQEEMLVRIKDWFEENLKKPDTFTNSKKPNAKGVAISWFKNSAKEHIAKMYELSTILQDHGIVVEVIKTDRPGYIVYEDQYQVTAVPYAETKT